MGARRKAAAVIAAGLLLITAAACSPKIQTNGRRVAEPQQPLNAALAKLKRDNEQGIQNNSITVSEQTGCFYTKPAKDADDITGTVACGPIRRLGLPDDRVWDTYRLTFHQNADGRSTATVGPVVDRGVPMNTALLVSPDNVHPAPVGDVPAPQTPQTAVSDRAVALPADQTPAGLRFSPLDQPARLITPTATIEVTAQAEPTTVPRELVAGQHDPAGAAPYYRPAAGQKLYAYRVRIVEPAEKDVPPSTSFNAEPVDSSAALTLGVAGGRSIDIDGTIAGNQLGGDAVDGSGGPAPRTLTLGCRTETPTSLFPCQPDNQEFVVLTTVPADGPVSLQASVAHRRQSVDLQTGTLTSTVSELEYDRARLATKVDQRLTAGPYTAKTRSGSTAKATWSMHVDSASLSAFDPTRGWAAEGKAWLVVLTTDYADTDPQYFHDDRVSSLRLTVGGESVSPDGITDAELSATPLSTVSWVFEVPQDLITASLDLRPTGMFVGGTKPVTFTAPQTGTVQIRLPQ